MSDQTKQQYSIEFAYVSTGQFFRTEAFLNAEEKKQMAEILKAYLSIGAIEQESIRPVMDIDQDFDAALNGIMSALKGDVASKSQSKCQNCERSWPTQMLPEVRDLRMRVAPGEPMPSGECPVCYAVCHPDPATES